MRMTNRVKRLEQATHAARVSDNLRSPHHAWLDVATADEVRRIIALKATIDAGQQAGPDHEAAEAMMEFRKIAEALEARRVASL